MNKSTASITDGSNGEGRKHLVDEAPVLADVADRPVGRY